MTNNGCLGWHGITGRALLEGGVGGEGGLSWGWGPKWGNTIDTVTANTQIDW